MLLHIHPSTPANIRIYSSTSFTINIGSQVHESGPLGIWLHLHLGRTRKGFVYFYEYI